MWILLGVHIKEIQASHTATPKTGRSDISLPLISAGGGRYDQDGQRFGAIPKRTYILGESISPHPRDHDPSAPALAFYGVNHDRMARMMKDQLPD